MTYTFFTVFDKNYAARGLTMIESLRRCSSDNIRVTVLALDEEAGRVSQGLADLVLRVEDVGDAEFVAAKTDRSYEEFCWTCAPLLSNYMVQQGNVGDIVAYLDADLYFFSDPAILLDEMGEWGNILIHPHRFSPDKAEWEKTAGTFNVGFVGFRVSDEARACTRRWREQVLTLCVKDPERGLCGDQGYLNEWPALYPGLRVMANIGGGVAPWNVNAYRIGQGPSADGTPVVFFHFHQLRVVNCERHGFLGAIPAIGYAFAPPVIEHIYLDYLNRLKLKALELISSDIPLRPDRTCDIAEFRHYLRSGYMVLVLESWRSVLIWKALETREHIAALWKKVQNKLGGLVGTKSPGK